MYDRFNVAEGHISVCRNRLHQVCIGDANVRFVDGAQVFLNGLQARETAKDVDVSPRIRGSSFFPWRVQQQIHQAGDLGGLPRTVQARVLHPAAFEIARFPG